MTLTTVAKFIWEPISVPVMGIASVVAILLLVYLVAQFCAAGIWLCYYLKWFDWRFSFGIIWAIVSFWTVIKISHKLDP
jgi:apolipoprotein N-acyltransferase